MQSPITSDRHAPSDPHLAAARARVADVLERFQRVELQVVVVAPPDQTRDAARDRARSAAIVAGRGPLVDEAVVAARDLTIRAFARSGFSGTWAATDMSVSVVRAADRVAVAQAIEEAVTAAVVEDLVDDDTLEVLRSTAEELVSLRGIPAPGSLSTFAAPAAGLIRGPIQVAILAGFIVVCAAVAAAAGSVTAGLVVLGVGLALLVVVARRQPPADR
jgi:hypothetical protein